MYSAEIVANQFLGPPLAALLLATGFVAADRLRRRHRSPSRPGSCSPSSPRSAPAPAAADAAVERRPFKEEMAEGFRWLWHH